MRNSSTAAVTDRIVNQFLCYLDGVVPLKKTFVVAATSRPDLIDTAVIRPGRIDTHIFCGLPTPLDRKAVLQKRFCQGMGITFDESTLEELVAKTEGYSFADLNLMAQKMQMKRRQVEEPETDWELLKESFEEVKPFCRTKDFRKLQRVYQHFISGSPDPEVMHQRHTLA
jgi:peroxin-1